MFWGLIMEPQRRYTQTVKKAFHISMAALDYSTSSEEPAQVMCGYEGRNYLLCTLRKPDVMQCPLDLNFEVGTEVSFVSNGKCHVHLTGYLTDELPGEFDVDEEEDEAADEEELTVKEKKKNKKRLKKANEDDNSPPSKRAKKAKAAEADENEEEGDSDEETDDSDLDVKALLEKSFGDSEDDTTFAAEEESGEEEEDSDDEEELKLEEDEESDEDGEEDEDESEDDEEDEANVSVNSKKNKMMNGGPKSPVTPKPKEKKQKDKSGTEFKTPTKETAAKSPAKEAQSPKKKSLQGGVIIEEVREGQGPPAKNGKFVSVYYEGRLKQNNKLFDSTTRGAGFQFRLGGGEVIKGWDVGVAGMKVGGKRRIICPPAMAYGVKGSPPAIPPNSTLVFEVELKKVK
ncbi:unnamed protein product [Acanthoscelides obtectus]|uniref:FK506-binding protein n=1 Tax=Acanthoscelides obtectus TaxID=200917 RepID=A0A9P0PXU4_ACAOB|nr:unnamed protein product [Acanthoscelides obtectus]CAK1630263.1 46 kDa FK506-binding nuclear protein [Acanthoscelides obtectus]